MTEFWVGWFGESPQWSHLTLDFVFVFVHGVSFFHPVLPHFEGELFLCFTNIGHISAAFTIQIVDNMVAQTISIKLWSLPFYKIREGETGLFPVVTIVAWQASARSSNLLLGNNRWQVTGPLEWAPHRYKSPETEVTEVSGGPGLTFPYQTDSNRMPQKGTEI